MSRWRLNPVDGSWGIRDTLTGEEPLSGESFTVASGVCAILNEEVEPGNDELSEVAMSILEADAFA